MIVPFPIMMIPEGPPTNFQLKMRPTLIAIVALQGTFGAGRMIVGDLWGGISDALVAVLGYVAVSEQSTMYGARYAMIYGMACGLNSFFDVMDIILRFLLYKGSFFDMTQSFLFNLHSFVLVAAAVVALLGAGVCLAIWRDIRQNLNESTPLLYQPGAFSQPPRAEDPFLLGSPPAAAPQASNFEAFSGPGYRLNSGAPAAPGQGPRRPPPEVWHPQQAPPPALSTQVHGHPGAAPHEGAQAVA